MVDSLQHTNNINITEFNRDTPWEYLSNAIETIDFIYHFAGEVKQQNSKVEFKKANVSLTKKLITLIEEKKRKIPILLTSSIHAELQKNAYGISKREAEIYVETYGKCNSVPVWIYRLPHVFGEGCKPNYNSVISTWIYNSIHDKEIVVFDKSFPITYVYVKDLIDEFINIIQPTNSINSVNQYYKPKIMYHTTLGKAAEYIEEFKHLNQKEPMLNNRFKAKLFATYLDYKKKKIY